MNDNLILVGMPGSGKSTVGVVLAKALGYSFLDTDLLISRHYDMKLQKIIDSCGLQSFLDKEAYVICSLSCEKTVIATGGSVICRDRSMRHLQAMGRIVYLNVPLPVLKRRIRNITTRGIAFAKGETLDDVYRKRAPLYEKYADITVDVSGRCHIETVTGKIMAEFNKE